MKTLNKREKLYHSYNPMVNQSDSTQSTELAMLFHLINQSSVAYELYSHEKWIPYPY